MGLVRTASAAAAAVALSALEASGVRVQSKLQVRMDRGGSSDPNFHEARQNADGEREGLSEYRKHMAREKFD